MRGGDAAHVGSVVDGEAAGAEAGVDRIPTEPGLPPGIGEVQHRGQYAGHGAEQRARYPASGRQPGHRVVRGRADPDVAGRHPQIRGVPRACTGAADEDDLVGAGGPGGGPADEERAVAVAERGDVRRRAVVGGAQPGLGDGTGAGYRRHRRCVCRRSTDSGQRQPRCRNIRGACGGETRSAAAAGVPRLVRRPQRLRATRATRATRTTRWRVVGRAKYRRGLGSRAVPGGLLNLFKDPPTKDT